ncbi:crosslink repair DNA glycosylase YcaQ family protein [uncultured Amaricoccus sp.]|uniref:winged helix-turn-helix domain-containing protein n=1 Tax=uncultured Amaricoccus sp. TaxID=339341 RepID=UPI002629EF94|nr:crosslink repair DNA glycosylase YcaQ family protein [uncultured Amaricoccus sp.]
MPRAVPTLRLTLAEARRHWLRAQRLDTAAPFGAGAAATRAAVEHLGYVQIDTINVIERSHHHILWSRIPDYSRADLAQALGTDKSVFEYWAHALAYIPTRDLRFYLADMKRHREHPNPWFGAVSPTDLRRLIARVRREGALSIRDIDDDVLVDKDHPWASRKPSKRALESAFYAGLLTVSARAGMVKTYELMDRHFGWPPRPRPPGEARTLDHLLDRSLRAQGFVSLDSICYMAAPRKKAMAALVEARLRRRRLVPVEIEGLAKPAHWTTPEAAVAAPEPTEIVHLLSPFDPLVIQRKRFHLVFGHDHRFEAYVPKEKRVLGYFALPVLVGDRVAAAIDVKADRAARALLIQQWTWLDGPADGDKARIEEALGRFEAFQFGA